MRTLEFKEIESVNGGSVGNALFLGGLAFTALALTMLPGKQNYEWIEVPKVTEVITPVYDSYGNYQGDIVDTYSENVWEKRYF